MLGECFGSRRHSQRPGGCCLVKVLQGEQGEYVKFTKEKKDKTGGFDYGMVYAGGLVSDGTPFFSVEGGDLAQELGGLTGTALNWM